MKSQLSILSAFIIGVLSFLLVFKFVYLSRISPQDEIAPGIVVLCAIIAGMILAGIVGFVLGAKKSGGRPLP